MNYINKFLSRHLCACRVFVQGISLVRISKFRLDKKKLYRSHFKGPSKTFNKVYQESLVAKLHP